MLQCLRPKYRAQVRVTDARLACEQRLETARIKATAAGLVDEADVVFSDELASHHLDNSELDKAKKIYEFFIAEYDKLYGKHDDWYLRSVGNIGRVYQRQGHLVKAEDSFRQVSETYCAVFGEDRDALHWLGHLGEVCILSEKTAEGEVILERVLKRVPNLNDEAHLQKEVEYLRSFYESIERPEGADVLINRVLPHHASKPKSYVAGSAPTASPEPRITRSMAKRRRLE